SGCLFLLRRPPISTLSPYTTLFRSLSIEIIDGNREAELINRAIQSFLTDKTYLHIDVGGGSTELNLYTGGEKVKTQSFRIGSVRDRKSTRLNSSHVKISYAVFCLKK